MACPPQPKDIGQSYYGRHFLSSISPPLLGEVGREGGHATDLEDLGGNRLSWSFSIRSQTWAWDRNGIGRTFRWPLAWEGWGYKHQGDVLPSTSTMWGATGFGAFSALNIYKKLLEELICCLYNLILYLHLWWVMQCCEYLILASGGSDGLGGQQ